MQHLDHETEEAIFDLITDIENQPGAVLSDKDVYKLTKRFTDLPYVENGNMGNRSFYEMYADVAIQLVPHLFALANRFHEEKTVAQSYIDHIEDEVIHPLSKRVLTDEEWQTAVSDGGWHELADQTRDKIMEELGSPDIDAPMTQINEITDADDTELLMRLCDHAQDNMHNPSELKRTLGLIRSGIQILGEETRQKRQEIDEQLYTEYDFNVPVLQLDDAMDVVRQYAHKVERHEYSDHAYVRAKALLVPVSEIQSALDEELGTSSE